MNEVLYMDKGRVNIPKEYRDRRGLADGSTLLFLETQAGALVLKPVKSKPDKSLIDHLKNFKGVQLSDRPAHCQPRA